MYFVVGKVTVANDIVGLRILESESGQSQDFSVAKIISVVKAQPSLFANIAIKDEHLVGTNGALNSYGTVANGLDRRFVIIKKAVSNKKVLGYVVSDSNGMVQKLDTLKVLDLARHGLVSNGKYVRTASVVVPIAGEYQKVYVSGQTQATQPQASLINRLLNRFKGKAV